MLVLIEVDACMICDSQELLMFKGIHLGFHPLADFYHSNLPASPTGTAIDYLVKVAGLQVIGFGAAKEILH
jgi:hypothetical protein